MNNLEPTGFRGTSDEAIAEASAFETRHPQFAQDTMAEAHGTIRSGLPEGIVVIPEVPLPRTTVDVNPSRRMQVEGAIRHVRQWITALALRHASYHPHGQLSESVAGSITPFVPLGIIGRSATQRTMHAAQEREEWLHPYTRLDIE